MSIEQQGKVSANELEISDTTMSKSVQELRVEQRSLREAVEILRAERARVSEGNPTELSEFRVVNSKLRANESLLAEVEGALLVKSTKPKMEEVGDDALTQALRGTGELADADRLDARKAA